MAYAMTKQGSLDNCVTYEFICDAVEDMNAIEDRYRTIGTVAIVLSGASGLEVYIAGSDKQWNSLSSIGGSAASDTAGLSIYICAQDEVSEGVPDVELPDEQTLYLVPAAEPDSGNLYDEYIYVDGEWEKFGSGGSAIDLSAYATKEYVDAANASIEIPDIEGIDHEEIQDSSSSYTLSQDTDPNWVKTEMVSRFSPLNSTHYVRIGNLTYQFSQIPRNKSDAEAQNIPIYYSWSEYGNQFYTFYIKNTDNQYEAGQTVTVEIFTLGPSVLKVNYDQMTVNNLQVLTEEQKISLRTDTGYNSIVQIGSNPAASATGSQSIALQGGKAYGQQSLARGSGTAASGIRSCAEGMGTIAESDYSHAFGQYNIGKDIPSWPLWSSGKTYQVDDGVIGAQYKKYVCIEANSDSEWNAEHWQEYIEPNYFIAVGNGKNKWNRSNAYLLDNNGNGYYNGDVYVGCNADSTGGTKLPRIPEASSTDGTYILQGTVTNGTPTYSWVSLSSLSGVTF